MTVTIHTIKRDVGIAGQVAYTATVQYAGEEPHDVTFVGSNYGGPVVMVWGGVQYFVTDPDRFGDFGEEWVRRFYSDNV